MYHHECVFSVSLSGAQIVQRHLALQSLPKYWALRVRPAFFCQSVTFVVCVLVVLCSLGFF